MKCVTATLGVTLFVAMSAVAQQPTASNPIDMARRAIQKNDALGAGRYIDEALWRPSGDSRVKKLFSSDPKGREYYCTYVSKQIAELTDPSEAGLMLRKVAAIQQTGVLAPGQGAPARCSATDLSVLLDKTVTEGNLTGRIPFELRDDISAFPSLKAAPQRQAMADRAIKDLQRSDASSRPVEPLMAYVTSAGVDSREGKRIEALLPTMDFHGEELDLVAKVFPEFAAARKGKTFVRVFLQIKNGDRLLADDLLQAFRSRSYNVDWMPTPISGAMTLVVEKVRNDERVLPDRTDTVSYAQYQVNLAAAVLLMPRNATYLFDVVSGGAEIEYGYAVTGTLNEKTVFDELVRGKVSGVYRRCQNQRVQNVFGGVSPAGFIANADQQQRCSGASAVSVESLRREVLDRVAEAGSRAIKSVQASAINAAPQRKVAGSMQEYLDCISKPQGWSECPEKPEEAGGTLSEADAKAKEFKDRCDALRERNMEYFKANGCK